LCGPVVTVLHVPYKARDLYAYQTSLYVELRLGIILSTPALPFVCVVVNVI